MTIFDNVETASVRVALLSGHSLVRNGLSILLRDYSPETRLHFRLDPSNPADLVIADAINARPELLAELQQLIASTTAPVILIVASDIVARQCDTWDPPAHRVLPISATHREILDAVADARLLARRGQREREMAATPRVKELHLSSRELDVLSLIATGISNNAIATELFLGINTVKTYIRTAYAKIGISSRTQAVIWALDYGLTPDRVRGTPNTTGATVIPHIAADGAT